MIKKLRQRFIKIATISVVLVMAFLLVILNVSNALSIRSDLRKTLTVISENPEKFSRDSIPEGDMPFGPKHEDEGFPPKDDRAEGTYPENGTGSADEWHRPIDGQDKWRDWDFSGNGGPFSEETPFSTRFFILEFDGDGTLLSSNFNSIASVSEDEYERYLQSAVKKGEGFGYKDGFEYYVYKSGDNEYTAIFLSAYAEVRSCRTVLLVSCIAGAVCVILVYILVVLFSRKAIDPVVKSAERQKQFITDASHELKTPLTVINTSLSVLEMEVGEQKWIDKAKGQTEKMTELVNDLVTLSRMDEESPAMNIADVRVSDVIKETAESFSDTIEQKGYSLRMEIEDGIVYRGDEYMIRQLVSILLENAVKYTKEGGTITLGLKRGRKGIVITETNPCQDLDVNELPKLFDRFYRADKARTSGKGFGIGLSIARGIAEAHHGEINASSPEDNVILFTAELK